MLERLRGKKIRVGVAFNGGIASFAGKPLGGTEYYEGTLVDFDDNFIVLHNNSMIGIKYIQTIEEI